MKPYLTKIELNNFQKHKKLLVDFTEGVNVISGASDCGKSTIRRALEWVYFNAKIDGVRRHGSKQTSVKVYQSDGIEVERVRSASINRYVLIQDGEEKTFDSIGKTIPDEIKEALNISTMDIDGDEICLNSAPQLGYPFLFDKSPSTRMKLFNKLTGNDILDSLFSEFNKDSLRVNREIKREEEDIKSRQVEIEEKEQEFDELEQKYLVNKKRLDSLKELSEKHNTFSDKIEKYDNTVNKIEEVKEKLNKLPSTDIDLKPIEDKINKVEKYKSFIDRWDKTEENIKSVNETLKDIKLVNIDIKELSKQVESLEKLRNIDKIISDLEDQLESTDAKIAKINKEYKEKEEEYKALMKEIKVCPLCGGDFNECKD